MSIDTVITDSFQQWLAGEFPPARVRELEHNQGLDDAWRSLHESGFCDALTSEAHGGAGANLETIAQMLFDCGRHALPLPFATTLWARAALAAEGRAIPEGPIVLARGHTEGEAIHCADVEWGRIADQVLVILDGQARLLPTATAERHDDGVYGSLSATLSWPRLPDDTQPLETALDWHTIGAVLFAALIAGAADQAMTQALAYAGERQQFGKPIGKFQALQQRLAVLAEEVFAARMAMQLALRGESMAPSAPLAMVAKARCSAAAKDIAAITHLVHGAIGITEEHDLQLFTRRLYDWRLQFGSETYWHRQLGAQARSHHEPALTTIRRWSQAG